MIGRPTIDLSDAPTDAFGRREPMWWGVVLLAAIEGTMFVLLAATYFYLRGNFEVWPPTDPGNEARWLAGAGTACLLVSLVPMMFASRAAQACELRTLRKWLLVATALGVLFVTFRVLELRALQFDWDDHAYGSTFWMILGLHTLHGFAGVLENVVFLALCFRGPIEVKHFLDLELNAMYWSFVAASWAPFFAILYFEVVLFPR